MRLAPHATLALTVFLLVGAAPCEAFEPEMRTLAQELLPRINQATHVQAVAVADFTDLRGQVTELGRFLAEELSIAITLAGPRFRVIDRNHLASLLREHKLNRSGLIDPATAKKVGQVAGVEALVTGTLTAFGDNVRLTVKVLDTETATMLGASQTGIPKIGTIADLLAQGLDGQSGLVAGGMGGSSAQGTDSKKAMPRLHRVNKFLFQLDSCERAGQSVTCHLRVRNEAQDRTLQLSNHNIVAFDDTSTAYQVTSSEVAGTVSESGRYWRLSQSVVHGVIAPITLRFDGFSPNARSIAKLDLQIQGSESFRVEFRDVPLKISSPGSSFAGNLIDVAIDEALDEPTGGNWRQRLLGGVGNELAKGARKAVGRLVDELVGDDEEDALEAPPR